MPRLIYHDGPPSVGLQVAGRTVTITRGMPSEELPEKVVAAVLAKRPPVAGWKVDAPTVRPKADEEHVSAKGQKGGKS